MLWLPSSLPLLLPRTFRLGVEVSRAGAARRLLGRAGAQRTRRAQRPRLRRRQFAAGAASDNGSEAVEAAALDEAGEPSLIRTGRRLLALLALAASWLRGHFPFNGAAHNDVEVDARALAALTLSIAEATSVNLFRTPGRNPCR